MDYRKIIDNRMTGKETVKEAYYRLSHSRIVTANIVEFPQGKENIIFEFDKDTDVMTSKKSDGTEIGQFTGDQAWGQALDHFKRMIHRKELDPATTKFYMTTSKGLSDISNEFAMAA